MAAATNSGIGGNDRSVGKHLLKKRKVQKEKVRAAGHGRPPEKEKIGWFFFSSEKKGQIGCRERENIYTYLTNLTLCECGGRNFQHLNNRFSGIHVMFCINFSLY